MNVVETDAVGSVRTNRSVIATDPVVEAIDAIRAGHPVVLIGDQNREDEGDLLVAASCATPEVIGFMIRWASGFVCVAMPEQGLDRLQIPPMPTSDPERDETAYSVAVDACATSTGISATDRATTIRLLADPHSQPGDFIRPGHVVPLRARADGVLRRPRRTEAAVDLVRLAGLPAAGALCQLISDDGSVMRGSECRTFADRHGLVMVSIADLVEHRRRTERLVQRCGSVSLPTDFGDFAAVTYRDPMDGVEHLALVRGDIGTGEDLLVRVHSECVTGDLFGSRRCDCGWQLRASLQRVAVEGRGIVVYLRYQPVPGGSPLSGQDAYCLQDQRADSQHADVSSTVPANARQLVTGAHILADLGVRSMRLLTNNPEKRRRLEGVGPTVLGRVALEAPPTLENVSSLMTKRDRWGHQLFGGLDLREGLLV